MKLSPDYKRVLANAPLLHTIILLAVGLIIYSNTFNVPFLIDDIRTIVDNRLIRDLRLFSEPSTILNNRYFGFLAFALDYRLHQLDVTGYHVVNLALHLANALLVYRLVGMIFKTPALAGHTSDVDGRLGSVVACATSLLFVCHPVHTEAVTYVSQRFTLLATLFSLIALVAYLAARCHLSSHGRWQSTRFTGLYSISLVSTLIAMKSKEIAFTLPIIITVTELLFFDARPKVRLCLLLPFLATMAVIPVSMIMLATPSRDLYQQLIVEPNPAKSISSSDYLLNQPRVVLTYIRLLLFPVAQNIDYDYPVSHSFMRLPVVLSWAFHALNIALAIVLFRISRRDNRLLRVISFGILWFYVTLSVESSVIPLDDVIVEHRMYQPSVGFFLVLATVLLMFGRKFFSGRTAAGIWLVVIAALVLAGATFKRNEVWQSGVSIWQDAVDKSPLKPRPHYNLGFYLANRGEIDPAVNELKAAIRLAPNFVNARNNLGYLYAKQGNLPAAIREFRTAVSIDPADALSHFNLGFALEKNGEPQSALGELHKGLQIDPTHSAAQNLLRELTGAKETTK